MSNIIQLYCPPGIGDITWILQKLYSYTDQHITFDLNAFERDNVSSPFLMGLERINSVKSFHGPFSSYNSFKQKCAMLYKRYSQMSAKELLHQKELYLEVNSFVESGNRIEKYLPKLPMTYQLPWKLNDIHTNEVKELCDESNVIVLYTSNVKNNSLSKGIMRDWNYNKWIELTHRLFKTYPNIKIVWIGSSWDRTSYEKFQHEFKDELIYFYLDQPASKILPLFHNCKCFISYQSGMSCISMSEKIPTYMLYFDNLTKLPMCLCPPESVNNHSVYRPQFFGNVDLNEVVTWVEQHLTY